MLNHVMDLAMCKSVPGSSATRHDFKGHCSMDFPRSCSLEILEI